MALVKLQLFSKPKETSIKQNTHKIEKNCSFKLKMQFGVVPLFLFFLLSFINWLFSLLSSTCSVFFVFLSANNYFHREFTQKITWTDQNKAAVPMYDCHISVNTRIYNFHFRFLDLFSDGEFEKCFLFSCRRLSNGQ